MDKNKQEILDAALRAAHQARREEEPSGQFRANVMRSIRQLDAQSHPEDMYLERSVWGFAGVSALCAAACLVLAFSQGVIGGSEFVFIADLHQMPGGYLGILD